MSNSKATVFMGTTVQVKFEVTDLSHDDQLALLRTLMHETGTTAAILSMDNGKEISAAIGEQWARYEQKVPN